jgi:hypothetical protein
VLDAIRKRAADDGNAVALGKDEFLLGVGGLNDCRAGHREKGVGMKVHER